MASRYNTVYCDFSLMVSVLQVCISRWHSKSQAAACAGQLHPSPGLLKKPFSIIIIVANNTHYLSQYTCNSDNPFVTGIITTSLSALHT